MATIPVGDRRYASVLTNLDLLSPTSTTVQLTASVRPTRRTRTPRPCSTCRAIWTSATVPHPVVESRFGGQYTDRSRDYQRRDRVLTIRPGMAVNAGVPELPAASNVFDQTIRNGIGPWVSYQSRPGS
jgi:iron complex outermembrane receptor protein